MQNFFEIKDFKHFWFYIYNKK